VSAADADVKPAMVQFSPDMEPLVRLIEETPRANLFEAVAGKMRDGVGYQQLLAALMLAGVRGIKPRPVGFKFHAVLVVNSAHLASLAMPDRDPLAAAVLGTWTTTRIRSQRNQEEGGWVMPAVAEPSCRRGTRRSSASPRRWTTGTRRGADRAIVALTRTAVAPTRSSSSSAPTAAAISATNRPQSIYVANAWRNLQTIGWRHAEPVLRSPGLRRAGARGHQPGQARRRPRPAGPRETWTAEEDPRRLQRGKVEPTATTELLATLRTGTAAEGSDKVVELLNRGVDPSSVWDGLFLGAGELIMRQPGIVGIHCVTSINALHFGSQASGNDETRRFLMLHGGGLSAAVPQGHAGARGNLRDGPAHRHAGESRGEDGGGGGGRGDL